MDEILSKILASPATNYIVGFGGISLLTAVAVKRAQALLSISNTWLGRLTLLGGGTGGVLIHGAGLVSVPGHGAWGYALATFCGMAASAVATGFSDLNLVHAILGEKGK